MNVTDTWTETPSVIAVCWNKVRKASSMKRPSVTALAARRNRGAAC
jgi:hypothetical protein